MKAVDIVKHPRNIIRVLNRLGLLNVLDDKAWGKWMWYAYTGTKLNLDNPKNISEKAQWLKLYDRKTIYTQMADKYRARELVREKIGEEYLIPLYGVWESVDDIDFDKLPDAFVLKCNHDSGGLYLCRDKRNLDVEAAKKKLKRALSKNYYHYEREWQYKNIKPRVICEWLLCEPDHEDVTNYKFYCFNGIPRFLYLSIAGMVGGRKSTSYEAMRYLDFSKAPFKFKKWSRDFEPKKPENFDKMIELCRVLSDGLPFVRIDLYNISGKIYFSEYTLHDEGGFCFFSPPEWENKIGDMLILPEKPYAAE